MNAPSDLYAVLGVDPGAEAEQIREAYRQRARACHPDRVAGMDAELRRLAENKMVELNQAYAILRAPALRAKYDAERTSALAGSAPSFQNGAPPRSGRDRTSKTPRGRMEDATLVTRAAVEQLRGRVRNAAPEYRWSEFQAAETSIALEATRGRRRRRLLVVVADRLDEGALRGILTRFDTLARTLEATWWRDDRILGIAGALRFTDSEKLLRTVEAFNAEQASAKRLLSAVMVDLLSWRTAPGSPELDDHLRFEGP